MDALLKLGQQERKAQGARAGRLEVAHAATRDHLARVLGTTGISVDLVPRLELVDRVLREYADVASEDAPPGMLEGEGVTIGQVRRFAEAAARFYQAAPWQHLSNDDLIRVESDVPSPGYRYALVLGDAGMEFGIGFYPSEDAYEAMAGARSRREFDEASEERGRSPAVT